jgi:lysylphosphatidylglycerol synthetase-like protein (DUF2156 family)
MEDTMHATENTGAAQFAALVTDAHTILRRLRRATVTALTVCAAATALAVPALLADARHLAAVALAVAVLALMTAITTTATRLTLGPAPEVCDLTAEMAHLDGDDDEGQAVEHPTGEVADPWGTESR